MASARSGDEIHRDYAKKGFVTSLRVLPPSEADSALSEFKEWAATLPGGKVTGDMRFKPHLHLPFVNRIVHNPLIINAVSAALDSDDILLWSSDFNIKDCGSGGYYAMHQDATYTGLCPPEKGVTVWLALSDPVDEEHGCMTFVQGSHVLGQLRHGEAESGGDNMLSRGQKVDEGSFWSNGKCGAEVIAALRGGEASLHHFHLLHKSGPNRGGNQRVGLALRYIAASVRQTGRVKESVTLVRGNLVHSGFDLEPVLPLTGEISDDQIQEGKKAHADAMNREAENYFDGSQASAYDQTSSSS